MSFFIIVYNFFFRFCGNCSVKIKLKSRYCWNCKSDQVKVGHPRWTSQTVSPDEATKNSPSCSSFGRPPNVSGEKQSTKILSLDDFIKDKTRKRSSCSKIQAKKNQKKAKPVLPSDVTISIGQKRFVNGEIKTVWGKRLPISVSRNATCAQILQKGIEKWTAFDRNFDGEDNYILLYHDGSAAQFMPGSTKDFFDLEKYKTELGKDFKKITLYLCSSSDLAFSEGLLHKIDCEDISDQECREDAISHQMYEEHGQTDIVNEEMQKQIESDEKLAQIIQEEWDIDDVTETEPKSTEDIYKAVKSKVNDEKCFLISTRRKADITRKILLWQRQTKKNPPTTRLKIHYIGQDGVDAGALRMEFLESTLQEIKRVMFPNGSPIHSTFHVQNGNFRTCGEIVATSIAQGGPTPCFLEQCAFDALWKQLDVLNISDVNLTKEELKVLDDVRADCVNHADLVIENGYSGPIASDHIDEIVNSMKVSFVNRRYLYMNEFKIGLNSYGLGNLISAHPDICKPLFLDDFYADTLPDGDYLFSLLTPKFSPESTSKRVLEETIIDHFQDLLLSFEDNEITPKAAVVATKEEGDIHGEASDNTEECPAAGGPAGDGFAEDGSTNDAQAEDGPTKETVQKADLSIPGIMGWLIGMKHKPMFEEKPRISVHFDHECLRRNPTHTVCFPLVGACGRDLTLPVAHMKTKDEFKKIFVTAVFHGQEFTKP